MQSVVLPRRKHLLVEGWLLHLFLPAVAAPYPKRLFFVLQTLLCVCHSLFVGVAFMHHSESIYIAALVLLPESSAASKHTTNI